MKPETPEGLRLRQVPAVQQEAQLTTSEGYDGEHFSCRQVAEGHEGERRSCCSPNFTKTYDDEQRDVTKNASSSTVR